MKRIGVALAVVALIAGCGGSTQKPQKTQKQIAACWNQKGNAYIASYAKSLGIPVQNAQGLVIPTIQALESGKTPDPGLTTAAITQHIKAIQASCGKLKLKG